MENATTETMMREATAPVARPAGVRQAEIDWAGRPVVIEHEWIAPRVAPQASAAPGTGAPSPSIPSARVSAAAASPPVMVFLHEGLGSRSAWRDWPQRVCDATGLAGLVYSRPGYGRSTPRAAGERWAPDFMHRQALEVLPALLAAVGVDAARERPWLFGHSDGGSIALIHAAHFADRVGGLVVAAPHVLVEDVSIASIERARTAYRTTDLRARLARHHDDPDSAFHGWNDIWLDPAFRDWTIEPLLSRIACPVLAVQGRDDEYGTMRQIEGIRARAPQAELLALDDCGHSPHRDQPQRLAKAVADFLQRHGAARPAAT